MHIETLADAPRETDSVRDTATSHANAAQSNFALTAPHAPATMAITKRDGRREPVDVAKIVRAVQRCSDGLNEIDPMRVALKTIAGIYDGATTRELDELSIRTAAAVHRRGDRNTRVSPRACLPATSTRKWRAWACIRSRSRSCSATNSA